MSIYVSKYHLDLLRVENFDQLFTCADWSTKGYPQALEVLEWSYVGFLTDPNDGYHIESVQRAVNMVFATCADRSWSNLQDLLSVAYMTTLLPDGQLSVGHVLLEHLLNGILTGYRAGM